MSTAKISLCAKCSMPIGDDSLYLKGKLYHYECSPYAATRAESAMGGTAVKELWQELLEKDDRTSPAEYPDMALITFDEFASAIRSCLAPGNAEPVAEDPRWQRLRDLFGLDGWYDGIWQGVASPDAIITHVEYVANERARLMSAALIHPAPAKGVSEASIEQIMRPGHWAAAVAKRLAALSCPPDDALNEIAAENQAARDDEWNSPEDGDDQ